MGILINLTIDDKRYQWRIFIKSVHFTGYMCLNQVISVNKLCFIYWFQLIQFKFISKTLLALICLDLELFIHRKNLLISEIFSHCSLDKVWSVFFFNHPEILFLAMQNLFEKGNATSGHKSNWLLIIIIINYLLPI